MDNGEMGEYCIVSDNDGHYYIIPELCLTKWWLWCESEDDDEAPEWAVYINGAPCKVRFRDWVIMG